MVDLLYPDGITCKRCQTVTKHYPLTGRKVYSCGTCGSQTSPLVGTIFEATKLPLPKWFYAIYLMATNKAGTSAAQLARELGVKWDTAHHMMMQIRQLMEPPEEPRTQGIENFWSTWKPRMKGTYKHVNKEYLQLYADEYAWRYSNRNKPSMFWSLMCRIEK